MSPLYTSKVLGLTLALDALTSVSKPLFLTGNWEVEDTDEPQDRFLGVCFFYTLAGQQHRYHRLLRYGPTRAVGEAPDPLLSIGEEVYRQKVINSEFRSTDVVFVMQGGRPAALVNLQRDIDQLVAAWQAWKVIQYNLETKQEPVSSS